MSEGKLRNFDPAATYGEDGVISTQTWRPDFDNGLSREITYVPGDHDEAKSPNDIKDSVQRFAAALRQAEIWAQSLEHEFTDEEALNLAKKLYKDIYLAVSKNCLRVYIARVEDGASDTGQERQRLERLKASSDFDKQIAAAHEGWVNAFVASLDGEDAVEKAQVSALDVQHYVDKHMMAGALLKTNEELSPNVTESVWKKTLTRHLEAEAEDDDYYYNAYVQFHVRGLLESTHKPTEMPLEQLRKFAGISWLEGEQESKEVIKGSVRPSGMLRVSADYGARGIAEYIGGRVEALQMLEGGYTQIPVGAPRGQRREVALRQEFPPEILSIIDPESVKPALERIGNERNELKAKAFVGVLALANHPGVDSDRFYVTLEHLILLVTGYERTGKNKANSTTYWAKAAEVIKYLLVDLPFTQVNILVKMAHEKDVLNVATWLMHRADPVTKQPLIFDNFLNQVVSISNRGEADGLASYLKSAGLQGFYLGFSKDILDALGTATGGGERNALEAVSREVLKLKGPAFWLAYEVTFLRRWAKPKDARPEKGKGLLEALEKHGYCDKSAVKTNGRVSYKLAIGYWLDDVKKLIEINMLDDPGVMICEVQKGRWRDVTKVVKSWLTDRGARITQEDIADLKVVYQIPKERTDELAKSRARRKSITESYARAKAGNAGRAASKKSG